MNAIRVIFVDDEPRVLEGLKRMLRPKRNEWQMTFVGSAQAALDALKHEPCEVVVTDMRMPGMNGAELLEVVQREYPDTIRLILSGQAETESVMKALGVSHQFLSKPCDAEILQGTISRAFALRDLAGSDSVKALVARINKLPTLPATYQKLVEALRQPNSSIEDVSRSHLDRPVDDRAPAQAGELGVLRPAEAGRRRVARRRAARPRPHHGAGARPGNFFRLRSAEGRRLQHGGAVAAQRVHRRRRASHRHCRTSRPRPGRRGVPRRHAARHRQAGARHGHARAIREGAQAGRRRQAGDLQQIEMLELHAAHTDVGAYLVGLWGLPNTIAEAIAYHEDPSQSPNPSFGLAGIVHARTAWRTARTSPTCVRPSSD